MDLAQRKATPNFQKKGCMELDIRRPTLRKGCDCWRKGSAYWEQFRWSGIGLVASVPRYIGSSSASRSSSSSPTAASASGHCKSRVLCAGLVVAPRRQSRWQEKKSIRVRPRDISRKSSINEGSRIKAAFVSAGGGRNWIRCGMHAHGHPSAPTPYMYYTYDLRFTIYDWARLPDFFMQAPPCLAWHNKGLPGQFHNALHHHTLSNLIP